MKTRITSFLRSITNFHEDEDGMEALQVVAIVALAAILMIAFKKFGIGKIQTWTTTQVEDLTAE